MILLEANQQPVPCTTRFIDHYSEIISIVKPSQAFKISLQPRPGPRHHDFLWWHDRDTITIQAAFDYDSQKSQKLKRGHYLTAI